MIDNRADKHESYKKAATGETFQFDYDPTHKKPWHVMCYTNDEVRWSLNFATEDGARKEFNRWR